ncbi:MAG: ABC transporter substrate-binding protein [Rhizobiaceae bacterium]|nr:ABC transporter substrate-binding protein [Rhizobiaceae bacterium]
MTKISFPALNRRQFLVSAAAGALTAGSLDGSRAFAEETPKKGGTLRVAVPGASADSIDPHFNQGQVSEMIRFTNMFDGLTGYDSGSDVRPMLAESFSSNETADTWTVKLRQGVKTHDGRDFGADDVIFSVRRILDPGKASKGAKLIDVVDADKLEKVDDHTVVFTLKHAYGPFQDLWSNRFLRMVPRDFDPAKPVGTGPFRLTSYTAGQQAAFARFDDYWGEKAHVDELIVATLGDATAGMNALRSGQVDITYAVPYAEAKLVEADPRLKLLRNPSTQYLPIYMRTDLEPFNDVRVRQALKLVADRDQLVKVAMNGYGAIANDMVGRYLPCGETPVPQRVRDIEKAKALLAEAGKSDLKLEITTASDVPGLAQTAQVFAQQAKEAGIEMKLNILEASAYLANYTNWPLGVDFFNDMYLPLVSRTLLPGGPFNVSRWNDPEFVELAAEAFKTTDEAARCDIIQKMRTIEYERGGSIVWGWSDILNAHGAHVGGLVPHKVDSPLSHLNKVWLG